MMHAMYNLYEISLKDPSIVLSPEEQEIPQCVCDLERKYIEKRQESVIINFFPLIFVFPPVASNNNFLLILGICFIEYTRSSRTGN